MVDFFDEVSGKQLCELISDGLFAILRESVKSLLDRFCSFLHVYGVLDHLSGGTKDVGWFPSEYILVCSKESNERVFLFGVEPCPDQSRFDRIR